MTLRRLTWEYVGFILFLVELTLFGRVFDGDGPGAEHLVVRLGSENGCGSTLCMCPPSLSVL